MLRSNGRGSYVIKVDFIGGGPTEITVDSGAEESACPWEWGVHFWMQRCISTNEIKERQWEGHSPLGQ
eukprot:5133116-Karenia_brevis.AAC.1